MSSYDPEKHQEIVDRLRDEFLVDMRDRLATIEHALAGADGADDDALECIRREAHSLKGMGGAFGFPMISMIAHRLEDYLSGLAALDAGQCREAIVFVDRMQDIAEAGHDPDGKISQMIVRGLPAHPGAQSTVSAKKDVEVLLVCPSKAISHIAMQTLRYLGCRVTTAGSAWEAIELAACARPDMVVTSAVMTGISGVDLSRAFAAMDATKDLPIAVLSSFCRDHVELRHLPKDVPVVSLDKSFERDIAEVIAGFNLD